MELNDLTMKPEVRKIGPTYQDLLNEMICPVCLNYLCPPIRQCTTGHHCCEECFKKIIRCPECRAPKSEARSFVLERIHSKLNFPCRYRDEGCSYIDNGLYIKSHEETCPYIPIRCPLRFNNNCPWIGKKEQIHAHCLHIHSQNMYLCDSQSFRCSQFTQNMTRKYYILFSVFGELFRFVWDMNEEKGFVRYAVYILHRNNPEKMFYYRVTINDKGDNTTEPISMQAECLHLKDDSTRFLKDKYLIIKNSTLKDYCNKNGDLMYTISLLRRKESSKN